MTFKQRLLCLIGVHGKIILDLTYNTEYCLDCGKPTRRFLKKQGENKSNVP